MNDADFRSMLPRMQKDVFAHNYKIVTAFEEIAGRKGCSSGQLALAWLMAQGDNIIPIPGVRPSLLPSLVPRLSRPHLKPTLTCIALQTKSEKYLIENFASRDLKLSTSELAEVRKAIDDNRPQGERYPAPMMGSLDA